MTVHYSMSEQSSNKEFLDQNQKFDRSKLRWSITARRMSWDELNNIIIIYQSITALCLLIKKVLIRYKKYLFNYSKCFNNHFGKL